jgi:hypothetical protein
VALWHRIVPPVCPELRDRIDPLALNVRLLRVSWRAKVCGGTLELAQVG